MADTPAKQPSRIAQLMATLTDKGKRAWEYWNGGVWQDTRSLRRVRLIKIANLTMRGFTDADLQSRACAMTYRTLLAIVPGLAMVLAIGRGFGLQDYLTQELYAYLPSQRKVLETAFTFVDSYLNQASEGLFVGIGVMFLLWTLVSLLSSVEDVFNTIFNVSNNRSWWRKIADYTAILLILPVLMICASGISIFMTTALHKVFDFPFMTPLVNSLIDFTGVAFSWLFFAGSFLLIPNTRVKPLPALASGIIAGTAFQILQWLFMTGQLYVTKYNAIYGSFSFLPLLLIWLQLVWLITFICAGICYSSQSIFRFSFEMQIKDISILYRMKVETAILTLIVKRFVGDGKHPVTGDELTCVFGLPPRIVQEAVKRLIGAGLINYALTDNLRHAADTADFSDIPLQPSEPTEKYTFTYVVEALLKEGQNGFIPLFNERFPAIEEMFSKIETDDTPIRDGRSMLLVDIPLPEPASASKSSK